MVKNPFAHRRTLAARPLARAAVSGGPANPGLHGTVDFFQTKRGVLVTADIAGLPQNQSAQGTGIFGFHIHTGGECTGDSADPFAQTGAHYNPSGVEHPYHAGDLPPLLETGSGRAYLSVITDRFALNDIIGRTVVIHSHPDDFHTQPSGGSGEKIACGVIRRI